MLFNLCFDLFEQEYLGACHSNVISKLEHASTTQTYQFSILVPGLISGRDWQEDGFLFTVGLAVLLYPESQFAMDFSWCGKSWSCSFASTMQPQQHPNYGSLHLFHLQKSDGDTVEAIGVVLPVVFWWNEWRRDLRRLFSRRKLLFVHLAECSKRMWSHVDSLKKRSHVCEPAAGNPSNSWAFSLCKTVATNKRTQKPVAFCPTYCNSFCGGQGVNSCICGVSTFFTPLTGFYSLDWRADWPSDNLRPTGFLIHGREDGAFSLNTGAICDCCGVISTDASCVSSDLWDQNWLRCLITVPTGYFGKVYDDQIS